MEGGEGCYILVRRQARKMLRSLLFDGSLIT